MKRRINQFLLDAAEINSLMRGGVFTVTLFGLSGLLVGFSAVILIVQNMSYSFVLSYAGIVFFWLFLILYLHRKVFKFNPMIRYTLPDGREGSIDISVFAIRRNPFKSTHTCMMDVSTEIQKVISEIMVNKIKETPGAEDMLADKFFIKQTYSFSSAILCLHSGKKVSWEAYFLIKQIFEEAEKRIPYVRFCDFMH